MGDFGSPFKNKTMDGQTSDWTPKTFAQLILSAYFKQLEEVSMEAFNQNQM
jgi:hypothetical protein